MTHATLQALEDRKTRLEAQLAKTVVDMRERKKKAATRLSKAYAKEILRLQAAGVEMPEPAELAKLVANASKKKAKTAATPAPAKKRSTPAKKKAALKTTPRRQQANQAPRGKTAKATPSTRKPRASRKPAEGKATEAAA